MLSILVGTNAYPQIIPLPNAYAHNDYWHKRPLYDALDNGFTNIEADIYLRDNKLIVAHVLPRLRMQKTLDSLYMKPLAEYVSGTNKQYGCPDCPILLMIDIKSEANRTYKALRKLLLQYQYILSAFEDGKLRQGKVTIVITGNKPLKLLRLEKIRFAFIDEDLRSVKQDTIDQNFYQTASCRYSELVNWRGEGPMPLPEHDKLCAYVAAAHKFGKKVRLWASPEKKEVWQQLLDCGVDFINTDQLVELKNFLLNNAKVYAKVN